MATAVDQSSEPVGIWVQLRARAARLLRSTALRALVGAQIIAALILLIRGEGWLQPSELLAYDAFLAACSSRAQSTAPTGPSAALADRHRHRGDSSACR